MSKTTLALIVLITVLLIGGGVNILLQKSTPPDQTSQSENSTTPTPSEDIKGKNVKDTLENLLGTKNPLQCSFSSTINNVEVKGTLYISDGKLRGDLQPASIPININGHLIIDSQNEYLWTNQSDQGYIFPVSDRTNPPSQNSQIEDIYNSTTTSCLPWTPDNSYFTLPSNITFQTIPTATASPSAPKN